MYLQCRGWVPGLCQPFLIQKTLREAWGFRGYVTSDCFAVTDFTAGHHFTPDMAHASVAAVHAGTDLACGEEYVSLAKAVENGMIKKANLIPRSPPPYSADKAWPV
ncbi:MAG: glycoside hydrolase family 3 N-terminal domain-containing protein [Terriglobia bacterium]